MISQPETSLMGVSKQIYGYKVRTDVLVYSPSVLEMAKQMEA